MFQDFAFVQIYRYFTENTSKYNQNYVKIQFCTYEM